jgi:hypothetical protein
LRHVRQEHPTARLPDNMNMVMLRLFFQCPQTSR